MSGDMTEIPSKKPAPFVPSDWDGYVRAELEAQAEDWAQFERDGDYWEVTGLDDEVEISFARWGIKSLDDCPVCYEDVVYLDIWQGDLHAEVRAKPRKPKFDREGHVVLVYYITSNDAVVDFDPQ